MIHKLWLCGAGACLLLITSVAIAGNVIDRIAATVNNRIILQSDWDDAVNYEALIGGKSREQLSDDDRQAVLNRLIDQELLREQMRTTDPQYAPSDEVVQARIQEIRKQYPGGDTQEGWSQVLARYNLREEDVRNRVVQELVILYLVEDRLGSTVQVDDRAVQDYYNQSYLPKLRQSGAKEVPLVEVAPKIRDLLTQQKLNEALGDWLQNLRESSTIRLSVVRTDDGGQTR